MTRKKGAIALDIDGTLTHGIHDVPYDVAEYLKSISGEWQIILITGRIFSLAISALKAFDFPYFLAVQNGADIVSMPEKMVIHRSYLSGKEISSLEDLYHDQKEDFVLYAGYDKGDFCYYRPNKFSKRVLRFLDEMKKFSKKPWEKVDSFDLSPSSFYPLAKAIGSQEEMLSLNQKIRLIPNLQPTLIRDPIIDTSIYFNLITHSHATKGIALDHVIKQEQITGPVIAAGDDRNDISMLERADIKIAMQNAPQELIALADIIAPMAEEKGILQGLKQALART